jgi:5-oxoprolinase (ATP-hydrolysing)
MTHVLIHPFAGVLSAYGMGLADVVAMREQSVESQLSEDLVSRLPGEVLTPLSGDAVAELTSQGVAAADIQVRQRAHLRYDGTDTPLIVPFCSAAEMTAEFEEAYRRRFSFLMRDKPLVVEAVSVEAIRAGDSVPECAHERAASGAGAGADTDTDEAPGPVPAQTVRLYADGAWRDVPLYRRAELSPGQSVGGPAILAEELATTVVEPGWGAVVTDRRDLVLTRVAARPGATDVGTEADPVRLEIFSNLFMSIAEQMGVRLQSTAHSVNIKERLDFSCAIFDAEGGLIANAPHIPVHLGSMGESIKMVISRNGPSGGAAGAGADGGGAHGGGGGGTRMKPGDVYVLNDPYHGGTHLPDVTVVTPVFARDTRKADTAGTAGTAGFDEASSAGASGVGVGVGVGEATAAGPLFYVASRGHHAEIGGISPGSMPAGSTRVEQEGVLIDNWLLVSGGRFRERETIELLESAEYPSRDPQTNLADLRAQVAANEKGIEELRAMVDTFGLDVVQAYMRHVQDNAAEAVREVITALHDGEFTYEMDSGASIKVKVTVDKSGRTATIDFTGTSPQQPGNFNAPSSVAMAAVLYVFRTLVAKDIPLNAGCLKPLRVIIGERSMLSPEYPAAVVAGNVETSQAVTGALYGALGVMAEGSGTMNNVTFGNDRYQYYETVSSGSGAGEDFDGTDVVQTKMTNSRLTDPEVLEWRYPVRLESYEIRPGSGGDGRHRGGNGGTRRLRFLEPMTVTTLSGHRRVPAFGLDGGAPGALGRHWVERADGTVTPMDGCDTANLDAGDVFVLETPGGGGFGAPGGG